MRQIILHLATNLGVLMLDITALLNTAAAIGFASAAVLLVLSKWPRAESIKL
jgi:hypothetical protein